ncbi:MAG: DegT/DnrJ/EryC1/StrS family aminotransferase [Acidimicrobiia bacterium]
MSQDHAQASGRHIDFAPPAADDADLASVATVLRSGWWTTGPECEAFEKELAAHLDGAFVVATSSCTAALEIAAASVPVTARARVGVPTWTFPSSALAVTRRGAEIVLLDVDPTTLNLAEESLERAIDQGLDAVVGVHVGGVPLPSTIREVCAAAGLPLIEDAAHAFGATDGRGAVGGHGPLTCLSFYATKNLPCGEGGALTTTDPDTAAFARRYRLHGLGEGAEGRYRPGSLDVPDVTMAGIKGNLPDLLAAIGRTQLARFPDMQRRRREIVVRYRAALRQVDGVTCVPPELAAGGADHLMVVLVPAGTDREAVRRAMSGAGIGTSVHFPPLHRLSWFRDNATVGPSGVAGAESVADRALSLPLHPRLSDVDVDRVVAALADALP